MHLLAILGATAIVERNDPGVQALHRGRTEQWPSLALQRLRTEHQRHCSALVDLGEVAVVGGPVSAVPRLVLTRARLVVRCLSSNN